MPYISIYVGGGGGSGRVVGREGAQTADRRMRRADKGLGLVPLGDGGGGEESQAELGYRCTCRHDAVDKALGQRYHAPRHSWCAAKLIFKCQ